MRYWLARRWVPWLAVVIGVALTSPSLTNGLQTEDIWQALLARSSPVPNLFGVPGDWRWSNYLAKDAGLLPWIAVDDWRIAFFRPLSGFTHHIDQRAWPSQPVLMHAHSLAWFALLIGAAAALYRRLLAPRWAAGLAALLYAVHDAHGGGVGWLASRNALVSASLGLLALLAHDHWRRSGSRAAGVLAPLALGLSLLGGEIAVGVFGYLLGHLCFLDRSSARRRVLAALPSVAVLGAWASTYRGLGYGVHGSGAYLDPLGAPGEFASAMLHRWPMQLAGAFGLSSDPLSLLPVPALPVLAAVLWILGALGLALLAPLLRREPAARFWVAGSLMSAVPTCAGIPADRVLFLPTLGAAALAALLVARLVERGAFVPRRLAWRVPATVLAAVWMARDALVAPLLLPLRAKALEPLQTWAEHAAETALAGQRSPQQQLILVNAPDFCAGSLTVALLALRPAPLPARTRVLYGGQDALRVSRVDERTLVLRPERGFLAHPLNALFRSSRAPMRAGQGLQLTRLQIVVTDVDAAGAPLEARFEFSQALESEHFRWVAWDGNRYVAFAPPAVGASLVLPPFTLRSPATDKAG